MGSLYYKKVGSVEYLWNDIIKTDKKRAFILDKALRLFVTKGLLNVTLENISEECEYTLKEIKNRLWTSS